jgi:hypothetical protein
MMWVGIVVSIKGDEYALVCGDFMCRVGGVGK